MARCDVEHRADIGEASQPDRHPPESFPQAAVGRDFRSLPSLSGGTSGREKVAGRHIGVRKKDELPGVLGGLPARAGNASL